ncbi:uncharacterized protein LOC116255299 [Nymphaea colorata]|nr:uncharacterized protein LOC116255299 [Nymphaea colorata]
MTHKHFSRLSLQSCTLKLSNWKPFFQSSDLHSPSSSTTKQNIDCPNEFSDLPTKKQCLCDGPSRVLPSISTHVEVLEIPNLTLVDENRTSRLVKKMARGFRRPWKRRRRASRSASGRSSGNRSRTTVATVSAPDFPIMVGTDSSGELFFKFDANWAPHELKGSCGKEGKEFLGGRENFFSSNCSLHSVVDSQSHDSGYVSEPGYKGDVEYGYGDELDEEEEDGRFLFWGDSGSKKMEVEDRMEDVAVDVVAEQKSYHRCRHKKGDCRMVVS